MKNRFNTREQKLGLLKGLLDGSRSISELRETKHTILMHDPRRPGIYVDGSKHYTQRQVNNLPGIVVVLHLPADEQNRMITPEDRQKPFSIK